jgi:STAS-like domain of unknown function (DUF4325)
MRIKISKDYTTAPGPRYPTEGKFSGQEFRTDILAPRLIEAIEHDATLTIDLDGTSGYGTSFLEESFGGLIREDQFKLKQLKKYLEFKSDEEPELLVEIYDYMQDAEDAIVSGEIE